MFDSYTNEKRGLSLIETMVAIGIFAVVIVVTTAAFSDVISVQRMTHNKQQVLNDLRLTLDVMAKELTSGSALPTDCEDGCSSILFSTKPRPDMALRNVAYRLDGVNGRIEKAVQTPDGLCSTLNAEGYPDDRCYQPISSEDVRIDTMQFYIQNAGESGTQPIISMQVAGVMLPDTSESESFETSLSITPRLLQDPNAQPPADNEAPTVTIDDPTTNDSYDTDEESLAVAGTASDNDEVDYLEWSNETTNQSGSVSGTTDWSTPEIDLDPSETNTIRITGYDEVGNAANDTLNIETSYTPPPSIQNINRSQESCDKPGNPLRVKVDIFDVDWANKVEVQRCTGSNCGGSDYQPDPDQPEYNFDSVVENVNKSFWATSIDPNTTYRWRTRAVNTNTGNKSNWEYVSNYITVRGYDRCDPQIDQVDAWQVCPDGKSSDNTARVRIFGMNYQNGFEMQRCDGEVSDCSGSDWFGDQNIDTNVTPSDDNTDGLNEYSSSEHIQDITDDLQPNKNYSWRGRAYYATSSETTYTDWKYGQTFISSTECNPDSGGGGDDDPTQSPFNGPHILPGRVQAEDFDTTDNPDGGNNIAYYDTDEGNNGGASYRDTDVDMQNAAEGGYNIGWIASGEWWEYTVQVEEAGTHEFQARVGSGGGGGAFHVEVDGTDVTNTISFDDTGGYDSWTTISGGTFNLTNGTHTVRIYAEDSSWDFNWWETCLESCEDDDEEEEENNYDFSIDPSTTLLEVKVSGTVTTRRESTKTTLEVNPDDATVFDKTVTWDLIDDANISDLEATFNPSQLEDGEYSDGSEFFVTIPDNTNTGTYELEVQGNASESNNPTQTIFLDVQESGGGQQ